MNHDKIPGMPEVKFNKNGYELRFDMLNLAKDLLQFDYSAKFHQVEVTSKRDEKTGQLINTVQFPTIPGIDQVLEAAQKMNDFVNRNDKK